MANSQNCIGYRGGIDNYIPFYRSLTINHDYRIRYNEKSTAMKAQEVIKYYRENGCPSINTKHDAYLLEGMFLFIELYLKHDLYSFYTFKCHKNPCEELYMLQDIPKLIDNLYIAYLDPELNKNMKYTFKDIMEWNQKMKLIKESIKGSTTTMQVCPKEPPIVGELKVKPTKNISSIFDFFSTKTEDVQEDYDPNKTNKVIDDKEDNVPFYTFKEALNVYIRVKHVGELLREDKETALTNYKSFINGDTFKEKLKEFKEYHKDDMLY